MPSTDSLSLAGKVAIVTGSGKENGIGAGIALALARAGARVVINHISEASAPRAIEVVSRIEAVAGKNSAVIVRADISTPEGAKHLVSEGLKGLGVDHIDILVNNAFWYEGGTALATTREALESIFSVSVFGVLYMIQETYPYMAQGGRIVNIGSVASKLGLSTVPVYASAKAAADALTLAIAEELGRKGKNITINVVSPGPVSTDQLNPNNEGAVALTNYLVSMTRAEERVGTVEDIADAVLLVVSEKARWITGQHISASGGITGG